VYVDDEARQEEQEVQKKKVLHPSCMMCRYAVGDQSIAETCDSFCTRCGQGHTHFMPCNKALCESDILDGVRHNTDSSLGTNADEYTHAYYWEAVGIEDPCMPEERRTFSLCGNLCASEEHQQVLCLQHLKSLVFFKYLASITVARHGLHRNGQSSYEIPNRLILILPESRSS
jgi:hypothetical protein